MLAAALLLPACDLVRKFQEGGVGSPAAPGSEAPGRQARLNVVILPSPVIALRDPRSPSARTARWTVQVVETGGVSGSLTFVNATIRDTATGVPVEPRASLSMDATQIAQRIGTSRLLAGGSLSLAQTLEFESPGTQGFLTVAAQLIDDEGNLVSHQATALVE